MLVDPQEHMIIQRNPRSCLAWGKRHIESIAFFIVVKNGLGYVLTLSLADMQGHRYFPLPAASARYIGDLGITSNSRLER